VFDPPVLLRPSCLSASPASRPVPSPRRIATASPVPPVMEHVHDVVRVAPPREVVSPDRRSPGGRGPMASAFARPLGSLYAMFHGVRSGKMSKFAFPATGCRAPSSGRSTRRGGDALELAVERDVGRRSFGDTGPTTTFVDDRFAGTPFVESESIRDGRGSNPRALHSLRALKSRSPRAAGSG